jgi:hypothetical protein
VEPQKYPAQIIDEIFSYDEKKSMIKYLITHQKTQTDWNVFRQKIPDELLEKWANIMRECRENGFVNPIVRHEKIQWSQIVGFERNYKNYDECSLCSRSFVGGDCNGEITYKFGKKDFKPCWSN